MDMHELGMEFKEKEIQKIDDDGSDNIRYEEFLKRITQMFVNQALKDEILKTFCVSHDDDGGQILDLFRFFFQQI